VYAPPGYLLFARDQTITAQPFDPSRLELVGDAVSLSEPVALRTGIYGDAVFSVAENGALVFWRGGEETTELTWFDRRGQSVGTLGKAGDYLSVALSPDDKKLAVEVIDPSTQAGDIWVIDLETRVRSRLTFGPAWDFSPFWSPDGTRIVFGSTRGGLQSLYQTIAAGGGTDQLVLKSPDALGPTDWSSADGQIIVYQNMSTYKLGALRLGDDRGPTSLLPTEFVESDGRLSPNGRWFAYTSNESGSWDVYVRPFPSLDRKWRISPDGGSRPTWRRDGKELFYIGPDQKLFAVPVSADVSFAPGTPSPLFEVKMIPLPPMQPRLQYAATADGNRFLVNTVVEPAAPSPIAVVLNWSEELKPRASTK
jgi:dipeptidyl aminopeptidase/acylaminoacyl peptidase